MKPFQPQSKHRPGGLPRPGALPPGSERGWRGWLAGLLLLAVLLLAGVACSPLRLLGPNQQLLTGVSVESDNLSQAQQERMLTLVQQKPNRNLPVPKLAIYQLGHSFYDSARIARKAAAIKAHYDELLTQAAGDSAKLGRLTARRDRRLDRKRLALEKGNVIMRLGEPPVIYDPTLSRRTVDQLVTYLHTQGYFRATATYTDSSRAPESIIATTLRAVGLRHRPQHYVPLRDSAGRRLHRRVAVTYVVDEGAGFTLSRVTRSIADSGVARVVRAAQGGTVLRVGQPYNEDQIGQERQRLETLLKNAGYYDFRAQYISFEADTSFEQRQVRLRLLLSSPPGGHHVYRLRQVVMLTDAGRARVLRSLTDDTTRRQRRRLANAPDTTAAPTTNTGRISTATMPAGVTPAAVADSLTARRLRRRGGLSPRDTVRYDSVAFASRGPLPFSPKVLSRQITLRPGQQFNVTRTQRTQRLLSNLDMFRFNTVSYRRVTRAGATDSVVADTSRAAVPPHAALPGAPTPPPAAPLDTASAERYLDALVTAAPSPRFSETTEAGGTYVADKVGPFGNVRVKWRNPFGGAEVLELSGRIGVEGQLARLSADSVGSYYTVQYGATAALLVPQFLLPFRVGNLLRDDLPRTRFSLSTTRSKTPYYTRSNTEFTFDYLWQPSAYQQYVFTPVDLSVVSTPYITDVYRYRLDSLRRFQGSPLYQSFKSIFEPSFSFTSLYNSNDINQTRASAHYLRLFVELGGLTRGLYRNSSWFEGTKLSVYNFARLSADYRRYQQLTPQTYLAWRLNAGLAHALATTPDTTDQHGGPAVDRYIIPYDKYFFAGGSNSVRAWSPRRLGTGSYATLQYNKTTMRFDGPRDYITEQPGELLLEGSVEYRFPIYSFIKGALFTDFGNVWTLQPDSARPGAEFRFNRFAKQFAVGSGLGIRFDFSFLILRFDIATKVYDPTELENSWVIRRALKQTTNQTVINIGIGYPF